MPLLLSAPTDHVVFGAKPCGAAAERHISRANLVDMSVAAGNAFPAPRLANRVSSKMTAQNTRVAGNLDMCA
jgi:hypothetical protein